MTNTDASDETTILATYTTRRDADMARDYLEEEGIRTFVRADDAGGMHPQLQRPHGVELVGMSGSAERAHGLLEDAGLLPREGERAETREARSEEDPGGPTFSLARTAGALGLLVLLILLVLLMLG